MGDKKSATKEESK